MSTHAGIAVRAGETLQTIYCHWDGHPSYMLPMLKNNYGSLDLALKLVSFGDASSIAEKLEPENEEGHSFEKPTEDVCVFYHRDKGEDWISCAPTCYIEPELFRQANLTWIYIFENGQWNVYQKGRKIDPTI